MVRKSYAKVNIFLKITGKTEIYHELASRFVLVYSLYDTISFVQEDNEDLIIEGKFGCETKQNSMYKAYLKLSVLFPEIKEYFRHHKIVVEKNIPEFAGLGGGSSNCATFMLMVNDVCNLCLTKDELCEMAKKIGADVPFFVYEYSSANVTGYGEIVKRFDESILDIDIFTPKIECNTAEIFKTFSKGFYIEANSEKINSLFEMKSIDILKNLSIYEANDLYKPAYKNYPELRNLEKKNWFFSGSGSSFFKVNNG